MKTFRIIDLENNYCFKRDTVEDATVIINNMLSNNLEFIIIKTEDGFNSFVTIENNAEECIKAALSGDIF